MKKNKLTERTYFDKVHTWGRIWSVTALAVLVAVPVSICLYFNVWPAAQDVFKALIKVIPLYWGTAVIEVITYTPMLGAGGTYLSFVTGNISNLKLPAGLNAMENAKVRANSEEGEVISTIAIGVSAITTTVIIAVGVLLFSPVLPYLTNPDSVFAPAFTYVLPALFGALGAGYFKKNWKIAIFPIVIGCLVLVFAPTLVVGTLLFITIVAAMLGAMLLLKLKWI
ncbi:MAG: hypothetical protein IKJ88_07885 [Clostridia bacterium]|nr:hypothetical protein [Clostridia bacterium]MBR3975762.1 hypothetical protein [Clostridia bacterium]